MFPIISSMIILPAAGGLLAYLLGRAKEDYSRLVALGVSLVEVVLTIIAFAEVARSGLYTFMLQEDYIWVKGFVDFHLGLDGLGAPLITIASSLTLLAAYGSKIEIEEKKASYYSLLLLFLAASIGVFTSLNLILFYFFWDATLLPMFFFIGIWGGPNRKYAASKFLLFTYGGSVAMLLGFIILYFSVPSPSFDFLSLLNQQVQPSVQLLVSILTFIGFGVKLPVFPIHTWLPDAHVEAPTPISVLLAGLLLKLGGYGILRFNLQLFSYTALHYAWFFMAVGLITMFYGAIVALRQSDMKRMVALTSINHMGFVLFGAFAGIAAAGSASFGIAGSVFQMFNHAFAIGLMFTLTGVVKHTFNTRDMNIIRGMRFEMPKASILLILGALAAMAAPLYSSFLSEFMVIYSGILYNSWLWVAVLVPGITAAYMLWMLKRMVLSEKDASLTYSDVSRGYAIYMLLFLIPLVLLLIAPGLILSPVMTFVRAVAGGA
ncbi:MAG: NADH-quinone oxidoreductase subunit M [Conexivisphaerales archaeon]